MRSQIDPKWVQNGSKMAPWRLLGGPGALPGGFREALGRRGRFLSDFGVYFGHRFGSKNRSKINREASSGFEWHFLASGSLLRQFWGRFWGHFWVLLGCPTAQWAESENNEK